MLSRRLRASRVLRVLFYPVFDNRQFVNTARLEYTSHHSCAIIELLNEQSIKL